MKTTKIEEISRELIEADTVSHHASRPAMTRIGERLDAAGFRVAYQEWSGAGAEKANLVAVAGPPEPDGLVLSGHLDVVPFEDQPGWTRDPLALTFEGDRVYGRGTTDMKVFLAQCIAAMEGYALDRLRRPVVLIFTSDEEVGCSGARRLVDALPAMLGDTPPPRLCWIGEPTSWQVFHAHKGVVSFGVEVRGQGGHSSLPEAGVSAIAVAVQLIARIGAVQAGLRRAPDPAYAPVFPDAPYTTLNFGTVQGGTALNMIADVCRFDVSYRPLPDQDPAALWQRLRDLLLDDSARDWGSGRTAVEVRVSDPFSAPGMNSPRGTRLEAALRAQFDQAAEGGAPFCTDGGQLARAGIDSIICGPGDLVQAHQPDESLSRSAFEQGAAQIEAVVERLCGVGANSG